MVISPGKKLRSLIVDRGLDQIKVADEIGVTRQTINNIVNDRQPISRDMANRLARLTGKTPGYWLQSEFPERDELDVRPDPALEGGAGVLVDHQIVQAIDDSIIGIDPCDLSQVQAASIDLRLGDRIIPAGGQAETIGGGKSFRLHPGQTVNVETRETVRFPPNYLGRVGPMTQIARFGIIMAHGFQIDPNYQGRLQFCLFNAGRGSYELVSGAPVVSLEITRLGATPSGGSLAVERDRDDVEANFDPAGACQTLIRQWLEPYVEITPHDGRMTARIADLDIDLSADTREKALRGAVATALAALHSAAMNSRLNGLLQTYRAFFAQRAREFYLDGIAIGHVARVIGLPVVRDIVMLDNGGHLVLPQGEATMAFDVLTAKLGQTPGDLVLALTRPATGETAHVTPFAAPARKTQA